jgi:hypothetical protein
VTGGLRKLASGWRKVARDRDFYRFDPEGGQGPTCTLQPLEKRKSIMNCMICTLCQILLG